MGGWRRPLVVHPWIFLSSVDHEEEVEVGLCAPAVPSKSLLGSERTGYLKDSCPVAENIAH